MYLSVKLILLIECTFLFLLLGSSSAAINRIWAVDDGEKIKRENTNSFLAHSPKNKVWNGGEIKIFGAKNEIVAFQLIIESDEEGVENVAVTLDSLTHFKSKYIIKNSEINRTENDNIQLFREYYIYITERSNTPQHWWPNARCLPDHDFLGWIPDALIPLDISSQDKITSFDIFPESNQSIWIDIYIPKDAITGVFKGLLTILENNDEVKSIPVSLEVLNFALPDQTHYKNFFFATQQDIAREYKVQRDTPEYDMIEGKYFQMAHRHRMDLTMNCSLEDMKKHYGKYITGEYYTKRYKYQGPGINTPHGTYSIGTYDIDGTSWTGKQSD
ncbi:MAG: hypothetical protein D3904_10565, partial [Candidatus Electrothrix sp. EH2]|nr:hypothetical protein [Candidatus Electrothrix sp. EH2]